MFCGEFDGACFRKRPIFTIDKEISCSHDIEGFILYGLPVIYIDAYVYLWKGTQKRQDEKY
jgi:hypothetical protein